MKLFPVVLLALQAVAVGCILSGIYMLAGLPWALIAAGIVLLLAYVNLYLQAKNG